MPRVPNYQQQFPYESPQVAGPRLRGFDVRTNAAMFGGAAGRQLEQAGRDLQDLAYMGARIADDYNTTVARDAAVQMQRGFCEWQGEAQQKQGREGLHLASDYEAWSESRAQELTKDMNETQRERFEELAARQMAAQRHWAEGYGQQQEQTYKQATWQAEIAAGSDSLAANIHVPGLAEQALEQIKDAAFSMGQNSGIGEKATMELMRKNVSGALIPAIHAKIQAGETGTAIALMKQYGSQIGDAGLSRLNVELKRERESQAREARRQQKRATVNNAYLTLYSMTPDEAQAKAMDQEWQKSMGLTAEMAKESVELLHTMRNWQTDAQKQQRQKCEMEKYMSVVGMVLGTNGAKKDPVAALLSIQSDENLDGKTKMEMMNAVQNNLIDAHDDPLFVGDLRQRIIDSGEAIPDSEMLAGIAMGKMRQATAANLMKLREMAQGANGAMLKHASSALNEQFRKITIAEGTPEQAGACLAAQMKLQADIEAAIAGDNRKELERVTSPEHVMGVGRLFSLSSAEQYRAVLRKLDPTSENLVESPSSQDGVNTAPFRTPGETINEYRKRIGVE